MLDLNLFCKKAYQNLIFMETSHIKSEKYMLAMVLDSISCNQSSIYKDWVHHKCNMTDFMHGS